jgi:hypothetical protein
MYNKFLEHLANLYFTKIRALRWVPVPTFKEAIPTLTKITDIYSYVYSSKVTSYVKYIGPAKRKEMFWCRFFIVQDQTGLWKKSTNLTVYIIINLIQCCGSRETSRIRLFSIPDPNCLYPGSRIRIKEFKYFNPKKWFLSFRKYDPGSSSRIRMLTFYPSRIPDPDPQH